MKVGVGLPSTIPGVDRDSLLTWATQGGGARFLHAGHDRPRRLRELRVADRSRRGRRGYRANPADDRHPLGSGSRQRSDAREAGRDDRLALERPPDAGNRGWAPRGGLHRDRDAVPRARQAVRRSACGDEPNLEGSGVRTGRCHRAAAVASRRPRGHHRRHRLRHLPARRRARPRLDNGRWHAGPVQGDVGEGEGGLVGRRPRGRPAIDRALLLRARRARGGGGQRRSSATTTHGSARTSPARSSRARRPTRTRSAATATRSPRPARTS